MMGLSAIILSQNYLLMAHIFRLIFFWLYNSFIKSLLSLTTQAGYLKIIFDIKYANILSYTQSGDIVVKLF